MNKTSWWGLMLAFFLPLACYFIVKLVGEDAVVMPPRYFADSVIEKTVDGRTTVDTTWHKIPEFSFTDQLGRKIAPKSADGKVLVVNTFFTHCPNICPALTRNVRKLQHSFENPKRKNFGDTSVVYFMSLSVDPVRDSIEALKKWATRFNVNSDNWSLLTGSKKDIYGLLFNDFKLSAKDGEGIDTNFIHTEKVMLVDRDRVVRGFYNGLDSVEMGRLAEDIGKLYLERDRTKPSIFKEYAPLVPILIAVPIIVFFGMWWLSRKKEF